MSVAYRFKSTLPSILTTRVEAKAKAVEENPHPRAAEPLERGFVSPEAGERRWAEAPDAGYARSSQEGHEFSHGRSQS